MKDYELPNLKVSVNERKKIEVRARHFLFQFWTLLAVLRYIYKNCQSGVPHPTAKLKETEHLTALSFPSLTPQNAYFLALG